MVFEGLNDTFGGVASVTMWGGKLVFDVGFSDIILEGLDLSVVEALYFCPTTAVGEAGNNSFVGI